MASKEDFTDDGIDDLSLREATLLCKRKGHAADAANVTKLEELRFLLKSKLMCKDGSAANAATFLKCETRDDTELKTKLYTIYDEVIKFAKQVLGTKGVGTSRLREEFPRICEDLESSRQSIKDATPHVLILGESGSGKSSFINLLLGEKYLPMSVLSNTHVVCEIRYAEKPRAVLYKTGEHDTQPLTLHMSEEKEGKEKFIADLKKYIQEIKFERAKVYLPCEILKCGLVIVDSPGIGETKEMEKMTLDYIVNAAVFMYVIDITNAGGMLSRVQDLVQRVKKKLLDEEKMYRPDSALFICNKWDAIKKKDKEVVIEDTKEKIEECWQDCKDEQIICFSTSEAEYIQNVGKMAPRFEQILRSMSGLIDVGGEIVVWKGYCFVCRYVERCVNRFNTVLSRLDTDTKTRKIKNAVTKDRLSELETKIKTFFDKQKEKIKTKQVSIAKTLEQFVNNEDNRETICRFTDQELPKSTNWDEAAVEVRIKVYSSIHTLVKDWAEGKQLYITLAKDIETELERECPRFDRDIYKAENDMAGVNEDKLDAGEEIELVPSFIKRKLSRLGTGLQVALGLGLSPVILVGFIVRLPVMGIQALHKVISHSFLQKEFKAAKGEREKLKQVCQKYAKKMVGDITDKVNLNTVIEENLMPLRKYIEKQQLKMLNQIENDKKFLKRLNEDETKDEDVRRTFEPLRDQSLVIQKRLKDFEPELPVFKK